MIVVTITSIETQFYHVTYLHYLSALDFTLMVLAYLCYSNQPKESFSEDDEDSPKLVKPILILDNPYGPKKSIPTVNLELFFLLIL